MENTETQVWLDFALSFEFINKKVHKDLLGKSEEIGRMINHMILNPKKYIGNINSK